MGKIFYKHLKFKLNNNLNNVKLYYHVILIILLQLTGSRNKRLTYKCEASATMRVSYVNLHGPLSPLVRLRRTRNQTKQLLVCPLYILVNEGFGFFKQKILYFTFLIQIRFFILNVLSSA